MLLTRWLIGFSNRIGRSRVTSSRGRRSRIRTAIYSPTVERLEKRELLAADLAATHFNVLNDHVNSGVAEVELSLRNQGDSPAGEFEAHIVWSPSGNLDDGTNAIIQASDMSFTGLAVGETETRTVSVPLDRVTLFAHANAADPAGQPAGTISTDISFLFLVIDTQNRVAESDEANNSGQGKLVDYDDITYFPWDKDGNGTVTPTDALTSIQAIGTGHELSDYNGDGTVVPIEALGTIHRIQYMRNDGPYLLGTSLPDVQTLEDAADQTVNLSSTFAVINDSALTLTVTSGNPSLVAATVDGETLTLAYGANESGNSDVTVTATNSNGVSVSDTFRVTVDAVNDPPVVVNPPGTITLTNGMPTRTIDLNAVFADPEGSDLTYRVVSFDATIVAASLDASGTRLIVTGGDGKTGEALVVVEASDSQAGTATVTVIVDVDRGPFEPVSQLRYARPSDQIVEFQSSNRVTLDSNLTSVTQVSLESSNPNLIDIDDLEVTIGTDGRLNLEIAHTTTVYGATTIRVNHGDRVAGEVTVIVLPPDDASLDDAGPADFSQTVEETSDNGVVIVKTVNSSVVAALLKRRLLSPADAFGLVRPATKEFSVSALALPQDIQISQAPAVAETAAFGTVAASSSESSPQVLTSTFKLSAEYADASPSELDSVINDYRSKSTGYIINYDQQGVGFNRTEFGLDLVKEFKSKGSLSLRQIAKSGLNNVDFKSLATDLLANATGAVATDDDAQLLSDTVHAFIDIAEVPAQVAKIDAHLVGIAVALAEAEASGGALSLFALEQIAWHSAGIASSFGSITEAIEDIPGRFRNILFNPRVRDFRRLSNTQKLEALTNFGEGLLQSLNSSLVSSVTDRLEDFLNFEFTGSTGLKKFKLGVEMNVEIEGETLPVLIPGLSDELRNFELNPELVSPDFLGEKYDEILHKLDSIPNDPPVPGPPKPPVSIQENQGTNGDQGRGAEEAIANYGFDLKDLYSTGKKLYDIAKTTQSIVGLAGDLFGSADRQGREGDYQDNDGVTYNLLVAQDRGGTEDRDVINTGYKNDTVRAGAGNDRISTLTGDDEIHAGSGRNKVFSGEGDDIVFDGNGDSYLSTGEGNDTVRPGAGNDVIESGTGVDTIIYETADIGNDLIIDPSRAGVIQFDSIRIEDISLRKDRYDLEIILPDNTDITSNSVKLVGFFEQDAAGWEIVDQLGNHYSLYELTGRITSYEALEIAFKPRDVSNTPTYPQGIVHQQTLSEGRFKISVAEDRRLISDNSTITKPGLVLTFEGNTSLDGWLTRNDFASLGKANDLLARFQASYSFSDYDQVTLVGVGEGGLIAQWFGANAAVDGPDFVNAQLVNTPDISGLISQVVREKFPEYKDGFSKLNNNYLVNANDWVSRLGIWAGNDETYSTWKAWDFSYDPDAELPVLTEFADLQLAHSPDVNAADFSELQISDLNLSQIRGVVSLSNDESLSQVFANRGLSLGSEPFDSTVTARQVFVDSDFVPSGDDIVTATQAIRDAFTDGLTEDLTAVDPDAPFKLELDFQASEQLQEHLAPGHNEATEDTLFVVRGTYGWESLEGLKAGPDRGKATSLERDSVKVKEGTFLVDLTGSNAGAGTYNVSITVGDRTEIQESLFISINGYQSDQVSTMPGDFLTRTYQINTLDDQLRIEFFDAGGKHEYTSIAGVTVEKVNYRGDFQISEQLDNDPSVVILTPSYDLPETSAGIEILKEALIAAAQAALTAGVGAVLGATSLGASIATGVGGNLAAGAAATATKGSIIAGIQASVGKAAASAALTSLSTSIPQQFSVVAKARGFLNGIESVFKTVDKAGDQFSSAVSAFKQKDILVGIGQGLKSIESGLSAAKKGVDTAKKTFSSPDTPQTIPTWVYEMAASLQQMSQQFRLGKLDPGFVPVDLDEITQAIADGKTPKQLLKLWQGSRDFLVLDWVPTKDDLTEVTSDEHRDFVNRSARSLKKLIEAYVAEIKASDPEADLDLLLIGHGAGYDINRETVNRLNTSDVDDDLDYVKLVTLDPISINQSSFTWYHPEFTNIVDRVDNYYQTTKLDKSLFAAAAFPIVLVGADDGDSALYHGGSDLGGLDGRQGGGSAGFYNRQARIFDLATTEELLRFRHWDTNTAELSTAELTDIEFSPDGSLVAASGKDGMVTVRYVDDAPELDPVTGKLPYAAGDVKFIVWGQEAKVKSVAFMQMEVDGEWKDFLLTISAANNPDNNDIDKNKVLLTDVETGLPVWQGKDVGGTQVEASPSGNIIVSTDSRGHAKIWRRVDDTLTFAPDEALVDAHTGPNEDYIADVYVINDENFVTAGLDSRMKLFRITGNGATLVDTEVFDNQFEGKVRNLDYDPYNGILAVASGQKLSLWKFDQILGVLTPLAPTGQSNGQKFTLHDHVAAVQGVAFSKPSFLLDADGMYFGDRSITKSDGTTIQLPRTEAGDVNLSKLPEFLATNGLSSSYAGLKLLTGGEDKTLFLYSLDSLNIGSIREESVLSGSMLPIREVTISPDGRRVAVVGEDNIDGDDGGPVKDTDVTAALDDRLGWAFSELFLQGRREHNAVPQQYIYDVIEQKGESYFWLRNSANANRPGDLDKDRNLALPPNKRDNIPGVDIAPIDIYLRPGQKIDIKPLQYLLEVDRQDYEVNQDTLVLGDVKEGDTVIGAIKLKRTDGKDRPNIFVFEAADNLDYTAADKNEFVGTFKFDITGPTDLEGNVWEIENAEITFRIINHKPVTYRDIVNLHPSREEIDVRPRANDYDFDNDDFAIIPVPVAWQTLTYNSVEVARYRRNTGDSRGVDIDVTVTEERLIELLAAEVPAGQTPPEYISVEFEYQVKEDKYKAVSSGIVEVRLQLQAGPENVRYSELGADQVLIQWDPVSWNADKYVIERYDDVEGWVKHSPNSDVDGKNSDSLRVKIVPNTDYWFRVVAKNTNANPVRSHASYEGTDKTQALFVPATDYVGPGSVKMESLGPAKIEVRWEKVFWDVDRYRIDLHQLMIASDGELETDAEGNYVFDSANSKFKVVQKGDGLSVTFSGLETGTPYLAIVTAKNTNGTIEKPTVASSPIFTSERDIPAGINFERIGPLKARISWATVGYAEKYRVVAIDPATLQRWTSDVVIADNGKNTNAVVFDGLSESTTYVVIVEAKSKKTGEWITLIDDDPQTPILPDREILAEDISAGVSAGIASTFLIPNSFAHSITIPSLQGLFVGAEFTLIDFSRSAVTVTATDGEILLSGNANVSQTLPAAFSVDDELVGAVVYRFVARESGSQPGTLVWEIQIGDELSEARVLTTTSYLAADIDLDTKLSTFITSDILPKLLAFSWRTPFWNVATQQLILYKAVIVDGEAQTGADGSYLLGDVAAKSNVIDVPSAPDQDFNREFGGLEQNGTYIAVLTTRGHGHVATEQLKVATGTQDSPTGVNSSDVTLNSFTVTWTREKWAVQQYRVSIVELDEQGIAIEATRDYRYANSDKSSKGVDGLKSGTEYQYTVEARSNILGWVPNTSENIKVQRTLSIADLSIDGLRLTDAGQHRLDLSWDSLTITPDSLFFEITPAGQDNWVAAENGGVAVDKTVKTLAGLDLNAEYDLRLVAIYTDSSGAQSRVQSAVITAATRWGIDSIERRHQSVKVTVPRITEATHFEVRVFEDADLTQQVATSGRIKKDESGPNTIKVEGLSSNQTYYAVAYAFEQTEQIAESSAEEFTTLQTEAPTAGISVGATDRHKFIVSMSHPSPNDISSLAVEITPDDGVTWYRAGKLVDGTVVKASDLETTRPQFEVTHYKPLNVSSDFIRVKAGVTYRARVVATYPDGSSVPSETTGPAQTAPLVAPTITDAVPDFKSIRVTFSHTDPLGGVEYFKLRYTTDDPAVTGDTTNWIPVDGTLSTNATSGPINGLDPGTTYFVQVRAVYAEKLMGDNYVNEFEAADTVAGPETTSQISPPTGVFFDQVERGSVRINWQPPAATEFHSYNVTLSLDGGANWRSVENGSGTSGLGIDKSKNSFVVSRYKKNDGSFTSLEAETDYLIRVAAVYFNDNQKAFSNENGHPVPTAGFVSPHDLAVSAIGLDQLTVSWKQDDLGGVDSFRIRLTTDDLSVISPENANWSKVIDNIGNSQTSKVVTGLNPGTPYYVQVRAVYGTSPLKTGDAITGPHQTNPAPPASGLDHTDVRQQQIDLKWNALGWTPESQFIEVRIGSGDWFRPDGGGVQIGLKQNTITGLTPNTMYDIRHVATYTSSLGQEVRVESASITRTTLAYSWSPNLLVDGVTHNSATANWGQLTNGGPDGYIIRVYKNPALVAEKTVGLGTGRRSSTVDGLWASTSYQIEVVAVKGSIVLATTPRVTFNTTVAPSPPTGVTLSRADWRQLQVQWTAPSGNFDSYVVRLYNATTNQVEETRTPNKSATSVNIGSLTIGQAYYAIVVAKTDGAETPSAQSASVSTYARETPVNLGVSQTDNKLFFTWNHFAPAGVTLAYRVERLGGQGNWQTVKGGIGPSPNQSVQSFDILRTNSANPLNKNQLYEFRVVAVYTAEELLSSSVLFTVT